MKIRTGINGANIYQRATGFQADYRPSVGSRKTKMFFYLPGESTSTLVDVAPVRVLDWLGSLSSLQPSQASQNVSITPLPADRLPVIFGPQLSEMDAQFLSIFAGLSCANGVIDFSEEQKAQLLLSPGAVAQEATLLSMATAAADSGIAARLQVFASALSAARQLVRQYLGSLSVSGVTNEPLRAAAVAAVIVPLDAVPPNHDIPASVEVSVEPSGCLLSEGHGLINASPRQFHKMLRELGWFTDKDQPTSLAFREQAFERRSEVVGDQGALSNVLFITPDGLSRLKSRLHTISY